MMLKRENDESSFKISIHEKNNGRNVIMYL